MSQRRQPASQMTISDLTKAVMTDEQRPPDCSFCVMTFSGSAPADGRVFFVPPGVSASDEPDSVLRGGEQEPSGAGQPADRRTAPPAGQRGVRPAAAGTPGLQE